MGRLVRLKQLYASQSVHSRTDPTTPARAYCRASSAGREGACGFILIVVVWLPYRRWLLLVILNFSSTIAVRAVLPIIYPATAITVWASVHCQLLSIICRHRRAGRVALFLCHERDRA